MYLILTIMLFSLWVTRTVIGSDYFFIWLEVWTRRALVNALAWLCRADAGWAQSLAGAIDAFYTCAWRTALITFVFLVMAFTWRALAIIVILTTNHWRVVTFTMWTAMRLILKNYLRLGIDVSNLMFVITLFHNDMLGIIDFQFTILFGWLWWRIDCSRSNIRRMDLYLRPLLTGMDAISLIVEWSHLPVKGF